VQVIEGRGLEGFVDALGENAPWLIQEDKLILIGWHVNTQFEVDADIHDQLR
jgi:hypothetical protein